MSRWADVTRSEPEFAERVARLFEARRHKVLATLRRDGSPRLSGIETAFEDGDVVLGMMPGSLKVTDLRRDPRLALHAASDDPPEDDPGAWPGDAKIGGRAVELPPSSGEAAHRFRIDVTEVVFTRVGRPADHLVIESWHPDRGLERRTRT